MFRVFEGATADHVWGKVAAAFCSHDGTTIQSSRAGQTLEILHSAISIADPIQRWVTSRYPPINPAFAIAEVVWLMTGRNDSAFLNYFNRQLPKYAGDGLTYHGAYGYRLRSHLGIDQLDRAYHALRNKPFSRQVALQIWDGRIDFPGYYGEEAASDIPCNLVSILKVRGGKLEWMQMLRSNDVYRGLPYNFIQFTTLQEVFAGWLELEVGEYNQVSNSLHVYYSDLEKIQTTFPTPTPANSDSLFLPKRDSEKCFKEMEKRIEIIITQVVPAETLGKLVSDSGLPEAFRNMLCVLCAEGARRRHKPNIASEIMTYCTNPLYKHMVKHWIQNR